jgi:threonine dehydrogenase-like Zn-dependent dehydrogenase
MGHEVVGRIVSIGKFAGQRWGVNRGDRVALSCFLSCRVCDACKKGKETHCEKYGFPYYGFANSKEIAVGGFAEYQQLHRDSLLIPVPQGIKTTQAAALWNAVGGGSYICLSVCVCGLFVFFFLFYKNNYTKVFNGVALSQTLFQVIVLQ